MLGHIDVSSGTLSKSDKKVTKSRSKESIGKSSDKKAHGPNKATVYEKGKDY